MNKKEKRHPFVAFMGCIGSGKTTAMEVVQKHLGFHPVREAYGENNFLPLFYKDMQRFALASQLFFLIQKANQLVYIQNLLSRMPVVLDVAVDQDICYVEALRKLGTTSVADYRTFHTVRRRVLKHVPAPDLLIYLKTPLRELKERIAARGREYENTMSHQYLSALVRAQDEWVSRHSTMPVVTINTARLDFASTKSGKKQFAKIITDELENRGLL